MPEISMLSHMLLKGMDQSWSEGRPPVVRLPPPQPARSDASGGRLYRPPGKAVELFQPILGPSRPAFHFEASKGTSTSTGSSAKEGGSISSPPSHQLFIWGKGDSSDLDETDIYQGELGDCYLLASLGAIAKQNPEFLKRHIRDNGNGTYMVDFYQKKEKPSLNLNPLAVFDTRPKKVSVTVAKDAILKPDGTAQKGARFGDTDPLTGKEEIWPLVVEKAYAKWLAEHGENIDKGSSAEAHEQLTGQVSRPVKVGDLSMNALRSHLANGDIITLNTNDNKGQKNKKNNAGPSPGDKPTVNPNEDILYRNGKLLLSHAYMVVGATGQEVHLSNPYNGMTVFSLSFAELQRACSRGWFAIGRAPK